MKLVAAMLVVAACGKPPAPHVSRTFQVDIKGMQFVPASVHVEVGDLVVWTNRDILPHTVTSPGWFDSGPLAPGQQWSHAIAQPMTLDYACTFHPTMKAQLLAR